MVDKDLYIINKSTKVGNAMLCPSCGRAFKKRQYSQAFCCTKCKDKYWNYVRTPVKHSRYHYDDPDRYLGDPENESFSQITIDPECDNEYIDYEFIY